MSEKDQTFELLKSIANSHDKKALELLKEGHALTAKESAACADAIRSAVDTVKKVMEENKCSS